MKSKIFLISLAIILIVNVRISYSQIDFKKIEYAYETSDSLIFYSDIQDSLICFISSILYLERSYIDKGLKINKVNIEIIHPMKISTQKRFDMIICNTAKDNNLNLCTTVTTFSHAFLKKKEKNIISELVKNEDLTEDMNFLNPSIGYRFWIFIYPYPQKNFNM